MGYLRTVFALIACKEASLFGGNSCSCTSASTFYKLREIERLGFAFGVLGPVLASWFGVAPLKGTPIATGWVPQRMLAGLLINGF